MIGDFFRRNKYMSILLVEWVNRKTSQTASLSYCLTVPIG